MGFSKEDRDEHNLRVARLAKVFSKRSSVIVSVIAPFEETRKKIDDLIKPVWIYVKRKYKISKDKPYEPPKNPDLIVNSDIQTTQEQVRKVLAFIKKP